MRNQLRGDMKTLTSCCLIMLLSIITAHAQSGASLGIGGQTAISRGVESVYWNPANLAFRSENDPKFQAIIYSFNAGVGNNSFSFDFINKYIGDGESIYLTENDKNDILDAIDDHGLKFDVMGNFSVFSWSYGRFGMGLETELYGDISMPKDIYQNLLFKIGQEEYDYSIAGGGYSVARTKFSYGRTMFKDVMFTVPLIGRLILREIAAGVSLSYLRGLGFADVERGTARLSISENGILPELNLIGKIATGGNGVGMDIGIGTYSENRIYVGLVLENLLNTILWNQRTEQATASLEFGDVPLFILGDGQLEDIEIDSVLSDTSYAIDHFFSRLPVNFRLGVGKAFGDFVVNVELANENHAFGSFIGAKYRLNFLNLFASVGRSADNFNWNAGFALNFRNFYFDLGASNRGGIFLANTKSLYYGSAIRIGF